ncbi:Hypothetical protein SCLAV_3361 [Streptomyces clavuligerus]|uniref:Uncharacterized protein n=1 Tax=Streptomyces clavuligerus TaxID=1901 RepID=E2Q013_STRCL|nr:Hypothetical protein SCLAV_3361 [Streptomyces clavuligerus]
MSGQSILGQSQGPKSNGLNSSSMR